MRSILKKAPSEFVQRARNPARSLTIGGDHVVFAPAYGSPFVRDLEGGRRYGTLADFENFVKLAYAIPWLHHSGGTVCEPVDVPVSKRHLDMVAAHLMLSDKPFMGSVTAEARQHQQAMFFENATVDRENVVLVAISLDPGAAQEADIEIPLWKFGLADYDTLRAEDLMRGRQVVWTGKHQRVRLDPELPFAIWRVG